MRRWAVAATIAALATVGGCSREPAVSNTGYEGVWVRGNARNTSMIAIRRDGDAYRFRWTAWSVDGSWRVECDWDGDCEELSGGVPVADRSFRTRIDPASGLLLVEGTMRPREEGAAVATFLDELEVEPDGLTLWSYTLERDGASTGPDRESRPKRSLRKVADDPEYRPTN